MPPWRQIVNAFTPCAAYAGMFVMKRSVLAAASKPGLLPDKSSNVALTMRTFINKPSAAEPGLVGRPLISQRSFEIETFVAGCAASDCNIKRAANATPSSVVFIASHQRVEFNDF